MMMWGWTLGPWMIFGWVLMLLFWAGIIGLVVWGISTLTKRSASEAKATGRANSLDIAAERYAKGEISREQFEQIKRDLS